LQATRKVFRRERSPTFSRTIPEWLLRDELASEVRELKKRETLLRVGLGLISEPPLGKRQVSVSKTSNAAVVVLDPAATGVVVKI
jgi:hypothetical protein